jgi:hypothetical protein
VLAAGLYLYSKFLLSLPRDFNTIGSDRGV